MLTAAFGAEIAFKVAGKFADLYVLASTLPTLDADLIIIGAGPYATEIVARQCLGVAPHSTIVTLTRGGRDAMIYRLAMRATELQEVSLESVVQVALEGASRTW